MLDPYIAYAVKEEPDIYEVFDRSHISLGFETEEYISRYNIPIRSKVYHEKAFNAMLKEVRARHGCGGGL